MNLIVNDDLTINVSLSHIALSDLLLELDNLDIKYDIKLDSDSEQVKKLIDYLT